jgi:glycosyltransferase involved in cell wall biosynthesis
MKNGSKVMIMMQSAWTPEIYHKSEAPEWSAVRNVVLENPQHNFILVGGGKRIEYFKDDKVLFYNLGSSNPLEFLLSVFLRFALPFVMRPAVIVDMGGWSSIVPSGIASLFTRAKFISVVVGSIRSSNLSSQLIPDGIRAAYSSLLNACFGKARVVLTVSESIKDEIVADYQVRRNKIYVHRLKISKMFNPYVPKDLKAIFNPNGPIVLTVARISPEKGLEYLVEASRTVVKEIPNVKFVIQPYSAEEKYKKHLLAMIGRLNLDNYFIVFDKHAPYSEIPKYMAAADVFALPSLAESLGVVLLEAMACGLPIVASNVGGIPEVVTHNYNGLLVEPGDAEGLANSIIELLLNEELRKKLSNGALATNEKMQENIFETLLKKFIFS